jgi:hypothetical protein
MGGIDASSRRRACSVHACDLRGQSSILPSPSTSMVTIDRSIAIAFAIDFGSAPRSEARRR